jgi:hypothetical protein
MNVVTSSILIKAKSKFITTNKQISKLEVNEITQPRQSGRFRGVSIGRDKDGYFVTTHRSRSKSYINVNKIPDYKIKKVASTG